MTMNRKEGRTIVCTIILPTSLSYNKEIELGEKFGLIICKTNILFENISDYIFTMVSLMLHQSSSYIYIKGKINIC